jgi:hypothetical protein
MIELTIVSVALVVLVGFVLWMWRSDKKHCHNVKTEEAKRLYRFIDDMFDRINSDTIEQYAMTHRIKKDIMVQTIDERVAEAEDVGKTPPAFVHGKFKGK